MKTVNKVISVVLSILILCGCFETLAFAAGSNGSGTQDDPYKISSATELQNINNDVTAHYILTNDIDLNDIDFVPIGNADSGAFSGSFDGNGHKIKNLNVFSGKYAGLFGCNEGVIKNLTLENIYVYGTRYIGGVVGQNTALGHIENCSVTSGDVESNGGIYAVYGGGICGYNQGEFVGTFSNGANISIKSSKSDLNAYAGGLIGRSYTSSDLKLINSVNTGTVSGGDYAGGLVGSGSTTITSSYNTGTVSGSDYAGGLVGSGSATITSSYNTGDVSAVIYAGGLVSTGSPTITNSYNIGNISGNSVGGLVGFGLPTITSSYNTGDVSAVTYAGGLVGYTSSSSSSTRITNSYNTGNVSNTINARVGGLVGYASSPLTIANSYNTGKVLSTGSSSVGGLVGCTTSSTTITNSYNTGKVSSTGSATNSYVGGLVGRTTSSSSLTTITNSYNTGNVSGQDDVGGLVGLGSYTTIVNSYVSATAKISSTTYIRYLLSDSQMKSQSSFADWDFDEVWEMPTVGNNGYPVLRGTRSPLCLNLENTAMLSGSTLQLTAYKNGTETTDVTWKCTSGDCLVTKNGKVTGIGANAMSTITATDSDGNKANCHILVMAKNTYIALNSFTINQNTDSKRNVALGNASSGDYIISATSSDNGIIKVTDFGDGIYIEFSALKPGSATISYETYQGFKGSCTATVTNHTNSVSITRSSLSIRVGNTFKLTATTSPTVSSDPIIWTSEDETVAKVDSNGNVTAITEGTTNIRATSNGKVSKCAVTVTKEQRPVTSMSFTDANISIYINDQRQLQLVCDPANTTDTFTYSSDKTSVATVSSSGLVTAKASGTAKIVATSSSGVKTYCKVTVKNYPIVVTGITLDQAEKDLIVGEVFKLTSTVTPSNATAPGVTWKSTDSTVATVSQSGTVEAVGAGKTLITAETENGIIAYCTVNVTGIASTNLSKIYVPNIVASENTEVDIPVMIEQNPGISFASIHIIYNPEVMQAVSVENGNVFGSVMGDIDESSSTVKLFFTSDKNIDTDGILAKIKFNIIDPSAEADVEVCYFPSEIRNEDNTAVAFNLFDGRYVRPVCLHDKNTRTENMSEATCTQNGYTGDIYCVDCGELIESGTVIPAKGHTEIIDVRKDATCTKTGLTEGKHCSVCGEVLTAQETVAKLGHSYGKYKVTIKATCTKAGVKTKTCANCGKKVTASIAATGHSYSGYKVTTKATCTKAGVKTKTCANCGKKVTASIAATGHTYKTITTKATTSKAGSVVTKCTTCGTIKSTVAIAKVSTVKFSGKSTLEYTGKTQKPTVTVKDSKGKTLQQGTDYTIKYPSGCKNVGKYTVTVTFKGNYTGTAKLTFTIAPKGTSISKLTAGKKQFTANWKKSTQANGYEIQYSTSKNMKNTKKVTVTKASTTSKKITGLKSAKTYYVRIRTYKTVKVNGKSSKLYSNWSSIKNVKTK